MNHQKKELLRTMFLNKLHWVMFFFFLFYATRGLSQNTVPATYLSTLKINYIRTWNASAPEPNTTNLITRALTDVKQVTQYTDGLGRPIQTVLKAASPAGNDIVTASCYDPTSGNEIFRYLPFASNAATSGDVTNDGNIKMDRFQQQVAFYNGYLSGQPNETNVGSAGSNWAYGQTNFEASPLNRVLGTFSPGASWVGSQGSASPHGVQQESLVNTATDNVQIWNIGGWNLANPEQNIIPANGGVYGAGTLYKTIATDEQGHQIIEYKDLYGELILKKVQLTAAADPNTGSGYTGWVCTYYVYDDHGHLRFVITPDLVAQMAAASSWSISLLQADELCYRYEYDQLNHMIIKKAPGTPSGALGEVWRVYDQRNRLVMEQDGNMRSPTVQKWEYIQYDNLDRPIAKGLITDPSNYNNLSYHINNAALSSNTSGVSAWPVIANYTSELLAQSFYDNYSNIPAVLPQSIDVSTNGTGNTTAFTTSYNATPLYAQPITPSPMTQGIMTGTNSEVLGSIGGQYIPAVSFYDEKGRVIQTQTINYTTGKDIISTQYSWSGEALSTLVSHNYVSSSNPQTHLLITAMTYDAMGRLLTTTKTINSTINGVALTAPSTNPTTISTCQYDELNRLKNKTLGNNLETMAYAYNVRGWLLGINPNYINGGSNNNYFGLELAYDKGSSGAPGNTYQYPVFNGNIAGTVWKSKGDGINRKYDFSYDNANRLGAAAFLQNSSGSAWDNSYIDFSVSGASGAPIGYDANGNIQAMNQNGVAQGGKLPIDQLSYNYLNGSGTSNRLTYVNDGANVSNSTLGDFHFSGATKTTSSVDYTYDANANTISDNNRSISSISYYSCGNLPQTITSSKGTIAYTYDAAGNKLRKQVTENGVTLNNMLVNNVIVPTVTTNITTTITYVNGFVYKSIAYSAASLSPLNSSNADVLQYIGDEEGRLRFKPLLGGIPASFVHDYLERDQLRNVRVGITDEAQQDIYPAATGETISQTVNGSSNTAQAYEGLYYAFNPSDFIPTANLGAWYTNMSGSSSIVNQNGGGTPANNDPYSYTKSQSLQVFQLCGNTALNPSGDNFGLGITLKVMAGDQVNILGTSFWHNIGTLPNGGYPISAVLGSLLSAFGSSSAVTSTISHSALGGSVFNSSATGPTGSLISPLLNNSSSQSGTQAPYAGINYIIFDDQFRPKTVGFYPVSTTTDVIVNLNQNVSIPQNGYIYVYVSNQSAINVYFDNLQVVHTRGSLMEEAHYYPSGLLMAGISDRAWNKTPNYFHYQGKEMQNEEWNNGSGLEEYDFGARFYDQQLGRWNTPDPAGQYVSPYLGMGNNWMNGMDANGESWLTNILISPWNDLKIIAGLFAYNNKQTFGQNLLDYLSRFTWQAPQEVLGLGTSLAQNTLGLVNKVGYFNGTTVLNTNYLINDVPGINAASAFTIGSFISGPSNMQLNPSDPTFQHEYGRYLQSQADGPTYLLFTAFRDILSPGNSGPTAEDANARALIYFNKYYGGLYSPTNPSGFNWSFNENPININYQSNLPISDPINQAALKESERRPGVTDYLNVAEVLAIAFL